MHADLPTMTTSSHTHSVYANQGADWIGNGTGNNLNQMNLMGGHANNQAGLAGYTALIGTSQTPTISRTISPMINGKSKLRIVRVFLVDPDERIPLDKRVLHRSEEMTTDATDQELFFGIPVQQLLTDHNAVRAAIKWKEEGSKSYAEPLKEIRIRDLVMSVTTIAEFQGRGA